MPLEVWHKQWSKTWQDWRLVEISIAEDTVYETWHLQGPLGSTSRRAKGSTSSEAKGAKGSEAKGAKGSEAQGSTSSEATGAKGSDAQGS
eukprot:11177063-Lingulodinium_polyedra.AAC.1